MKYKSDLVIVTTEAFPIGMAATNRILSYAKEISKTKKSHILITRPVDDIKDVKNKANKGEIDNLYFEYTAGTSIWPYEKNKISKLILVIKALFRLVVRLIQLRPKTIIIYTRFKSERYLVKVLKPYLKYQLIIEENEYPKILYLTSNKNKITRGLKYYAYADGMLVISKELKSYYESLGAKKIFLLPMTVDLDRFGNKIEPTKLPYEYFIYVGGGGGFMRDGAFNMIHAFNMFHKENPNIKFLIVGPMSSENPKMIEILNYIDKHKLHNHLILMGAMPSNEIPPLLMGSKGIIMTPQEDYPSGGFPTKLGEFLASGRPVITTNVSELADYLNDENSFIFLPGDDTLITNAMKEILRDEAKANEVGQAGLHTAFTSFNIKSYISELTSFLKI